MRPPRRTKPGAGATASRSSCPAKYTDLMKPVATFTALLNRLQNGGVSTMSRTTVSFPMACVTQIALVGVARARCATLHPNAKSRTAHSGVVEAARIHEPNDAWSEAASAILTALRPARYPQGAALSSYPMRYETWWTRERRATCHATWPVSHRQG
jgi:hypothetical protein